MVNALEPSFSPDLVVLGSGIVGLSCSYAAAHAGLRVLRISSAEAEKTASRCATGIASVKGVLVPREPLFREKLRNHCSFVGWIEAVARESQVPVEINAGPILEPWVSAENYRKIKARIDGGRYAGLFRRRILAASELPSVLRGCLGAFAYSGDYVYSPQQVLAALAACDVAGRHRSLTAEVVAAEPDGLGSWQVRLEGVADPIKAPQVVLAAGAESTKLLPTFGLAPMETLAGRTWRVRGPALQPHPAIIRGAARIAFHASEVSLSGIDNGNGSGALPSLPSYYHQEFHRESTGYEVRLDEGVRLFGPGRRPFVGSLAPGLFAAFGFGRSGFSLGPAAANYLVPFLVRHEFSPLWFA
jgi:glycine/D-amino acid oxidase-like deaminating enzyme